jgi:hypothetical protein
MVRLSLRFRGFQPTVETLSAHSRTVTRARTGHGVEVVCESVSVVCGRRLTATRCLGRSMTLWFLLRRDGWDPELVLGTAPAAGQLRAHAWVELDGAPLNEAVDPRRRFEPLPTRVGTDGRLSRR